VDDKVKVFLSEADVLDYPGMFLQGSASNPYGLTGKFSPCPQKEAKKSDRDVVVEAYESYIAKTAGKREFPCRWAACEPPPQGNPPQANSKALTALLAPPVSPRVL
jgi:hypothetical protein